MRALKIIFPLVGLLLLPSCTSPAPEATPVDRAQWLIGEWENRTPRGIVIEEWSRVSSTELSGTSFTRSGDQVRVLETIRLVQEGDSLFYVPVVADQNDGQPVRFALTEVTDGSMRFENPGHDFPQVISYRRIGADSLIAEISGNMGGTERSIAFPMRRVDTD